MRWVIAAAVGLILVVAAFVGGWVLGKYAPKTAGGPNGMVIAPAPADWTEWTYPGGKQTGSATGGGSSLGNVRVGPLHTAQVTTPDEFETVLAFYATKLAHPGIASPGGTESSGGIRGVATGNEVYAYASQSDTRPGVKAKAITYRTSNYDLVITVTRAGGEKETHILIAYMPHRP
jgi:hypothetical protein